MLVKLYEWVRGVFRAGCVDGIDDAMPEIMEQVRTKVRQAIVDGIADAMQELSQPVGGNGRRRAKEAKV